MVTGMWHVMEPQEKWDTYSCSELAPCIPVCICWQAKLSFFQGEKQECCSLVQVVFVAQRTLLEGAELLSRLSRGAAHAEMETWFL